MKWFLLIIIIVNIREGELIRCDRQPQRYAIEKLKYDVMCKYDKSFRPNNNHDDTQDKTEISVNAFIKEFNFNEESQKMKVNIKMVVSWTDNHFQWRTKNYDNIETIYEESSDIWMPEIAAANCDSSEIQESCRKKKCSINFEGKVRCPYVTSFIAYCNGDFSYWPFDRQTCILFLESNDEINFDSNSISITNLYHKKNNKWLLLHSDVQRMDGAYKGISTPSLKYSFTIERHYTYEVAFILCPAFVLVGINLVVFLLDSESSDRLLLIVSNVILHFLLIHQVKLYVPASDIIPNIVVFIRDSIIMTGVLILETIITRIISRLQIVVPFWINFLTKFSLNTRRYFFVDNNNEQINHHLSADTMNERMMLSEIFQSNTKANLKWKSISNLIDLLLFSIYITLYVLMYYTLIPKVYKEISK